jgi:deoxycytidylate deaminase
MSKELERKARRMSQTLLLRREDAPRCRHFSFVFDGNRLVGVGTNRPKTHPANLRYAYTNRQMQDISYIVGIHSEMDAVLRIGMRECRGLTLVNTRINRKGEFDLSMPCGGCSRMIADAGFEKVLYTDRKGEFRTWTPASSCPRTA